MHYKFFKKIIEAFGYKLIDKNLVKNERIISKHSYLSLEKVLNNLFVNNHIKSIVQIGANDGQRFDIINKFIKKFYPLTIFVEPIKSNFVNLKKHYLNQKNLFYENSAISVSNEINELYKVMDNKINLYDNHVIGITSFDRKHLLKHGIKNYHITKEKVNSISIKDLFIKYKLKNLDLLLIDTEGYDAMIVKDFLINLNIRPIIIFEYIHIKHKIFSDTINLLINCNYVLFKLEENIVCLQKDDSGLINFN